MRYTNPVIRGFHPDPSVCRVGRDYYLVTSSFEYFPGVPLFHSRDLVHWRKIGHCLTRPSQLALADAANSDGIWAPSLRFHEGRFYVVTTNVRRSPFRSRNFFVTAEDPAGEWSEPVWLDEEGIDPDLFWDEDGSAYYLRNGAGGIYLGPLDVAAGRLTGGVERIWTGSGGEYPEGPHIYRVGGVYYLMIAEGGTGYDHVETVARAESPFGPYESCPRNPMLTHRDRTSHPIQCTGHADLVEAHDGSWWAVFLAVRDRHPGEHSFHLGRETCLAPVRWTDDGWPIVGRDGRIEVEMEGPSWAPHPWERPPVRDSFDGPELGPRWNTLRAPLEEWGSLEDRPGWLRLDGTEATLGDVGPVAFVGRRQREMDCRAATLLEFSPRRDGEEAGLTVRMSEGLHYDLGVKMMEEEPLLIVRRCVADAAGLVWRRPLPAGRVELSVQADADAYRFSFATPGEACRQVAALRVADIANEGDAPFTGVYVGLYATGDGRPSGAPAWFDWFELVCADA